MDTEEPTAGQLRGLQSEDGCHGGGGTSCPVQLQEVEHLQPACDPCAVPGAAIDDVVASASDSCPTSCTTFGCG